MSIPTPRIEVGFDLTNSPDWPFLRLDDATRGKLDSEYTLGGELFVDISSRVRSYNIQRGRSSDFDNFTSGQATIELNNHDRAFDPLYTASPYYGNIIPRREINIYADGEIQFSGFISDWNLSYLPNGDSIVTAIANDRLGVIAGQTLTGFTPPEELTGARINRILDTDDVNWSTEARDIAVGQSLLSDADIADDTNALQYLQLVAQTEPGNLFIAKNGYLTFTDRTVTPTSASLTEFGDGGIPFQNVGVVYGSENLYNEVVISRQGGGTAIASDLDSQLVYGIRNLTQNDLLYQNDAQSIELAVTYASRYSQPEYRFDSLEIALHDMADPSEVLAMELGSIAKITFLPNGIGDAIVRYAEVIRIDHTVNPSTHFVTLGFQSIDNAYLVLDDAEFGKLDTYSLSW